MRNTKPAEKKVQTAVQIQQQLYAGPLPQPEALAKYDQIVPGAAERIIKMAEKEMEQRHNADNLMTRNAIRTTFLGIIFAFLSVLILSGLVFYALYKGFDTVAATIAVGAIAAVASVFVFFRKRKNN